MKLTVPTKTIHNRCAIHQCESEHAEALLALIDSPIKTYSLTQFGDLLVSVHIEFLGKNHVPYDALYEFFDAEEAKYFIEGAVDNLEKLISKK